MSLCLHPQVEIESASKRNATLFETKKSLEELYQDSLTETSNQANNWLSQLSARKAAALNASVSSPVLNFRGSSFVRSVEQPVESRLTVQALASAPSSGSSTIHVNPPFTRSQAHAGQLTVLSIPGSSGVQVHSGSSRLTVQAEYSTASSSLRSCPASLQVDPEPPIIPLVDLESSPSGQSPIPNEPLSSTSGLSIERGQAQKRGSFQQSSSPCLGEAPRSRPRHVSLRFKLNLHVSCFQNIFCGFQSHKVFTSKFSVYFYFSFPFQFQIFLFLNCFDQIMCSWFSDSIVFFYEVYCMFFFK